MHLRENSAMRPSAESRQVRQRFSGADSFREFPGNELGKFDYLVNTGKPEGAKKSNAKIVFV